MEMAAAISSRITPPADDLKTGVDEHPSGIYIKGMEIDKIGHFMLFAICSFLLFRGGPYIPGWVIMAHASLLAGATELLQFFSNGRSPALMDLGIDLGGIITGMLLFTLLVHVMGREVESV